MVRPFKVTEETEDLTGQGCPWEEDREVERMTWTPTPMQLARYRRREVELCLGNMAILAVQADPVARITITNGLDPGQGYGAISVIVGGPEPWDTLHSLRTWGAASTGAKVLAVAKNVFDLTSAAE